MVHQQPLRATFVEVCTRLPEQRVNGEFKVQLLTPQLRQVLRERRFRPVRLALTLTLSGFAIGVVRAGALVVVVRSALIREIAEEFPSLGADAVNATRPDLHTAVKGARRALEVDRIVCVVAQQRHVVEIVDQSQVPGVVRVDFLRCGMSRDKGEDAMGLTLSVAIFIHCSKLEVMTSKDTIG